MPTSSHHQSGVWTWWPLHTIHLSYSFTGGSCKGSLLSSSSGMVASSCRKCLMPSSSFSKGPRLRSAEGCKTAWSSSDVNSRTKKVTHQCGLVGLGHVDPDWLPSPGVALQHLLLCPLNPLLDWSLLCEWWQLSGLVLVVDWLSLLILYSNMEAAISAHWWASLASASSCSPEVSCLSLWEPPSQ